MVLRIHVYVHMQHLPDTGLRVRKWDVGNFQIADTPAWPPVCTAYEHEIGRASCRERVCLYV